MTIKRFGFWLAIFNLFATILYFILVIAAILDGGLPPVEPYQTLISLVSYLAVPFLVLMWVAIYQISPSEKMVYSLGSLALIIIFATLTSINRYNALTVVPQALNIQQTHALEWFQPYGWPSIMAAMEVQAWGFYFGLALLCLLPVFTKGRLEKIIFWVLLVSGLLSLLACLGQVLNNVLLNMLGLIAWGPGLITLTILWALWFRPTIIHED